MNKFSSLKFSDKKLIVISLIFFFGIGAFIFYQGYPRNSQKYQYNLYRYLPLSDGSLPDIYGKELWEEWENIRGEKIDPGSPGPNWPLFPLYYLDTNTAFKKYILPSGEVTDKVALLKEFSSLSREKKFSNIATFDPQRRGYYLRKVHPLNTPQEVLEDLSSVLQILDRQDVPSDYFLGNEYQKAYDIIDTYYFDVHVWSHLTNETAKKNLFLHLFTKYAKDNKNWKPYEKDVSDCTQYAQRIYLLMDPGEVFIEENYFNFLFSEKRHIEERTKLCNKIPTVLYTLLDPYILKKEEDVSGHAMISFTPDNKLDQLILGEPQTGEFVPIEEGIGDILDQEFTQYNTMFHLGKIIDIQDDTKHEAFIQIEGGYFFPKSLLNDDNSDDELQGSPHNKPILLNPQNWHICNLLSFYIGETLSAQTVNWSNFLSVFEGTVEQENLTQDQTKEIMNTSMDIICYGLNGVNPSDIQSLQDNMTFLYTLGEGYQDNSPQMENIVNSLYDFFYSF